MKSKKITPFSVYKELLKKRVFLFTFGEFQMIFGVSPARTKYFLETYTRKGLFSRLRKGIYALKNNSPTEEEIAGFLYRPSYLSFEYALAKHGIIPEMVYEVTSATTKPTRTFSLGDKNFTYLKIKKEAFAGYSLAKDGSRGNFIADPEKSLVDYLYFVSLGKKSLNERLNLNNLAKSKVVGYAKLYDRPGLLKIIDRLCFPKKQSKT